MMQLLVAHVKLKMIHKLIQKFDPCVNSVSRRVIFCNSVRNFLFKHPFSIHIKLYIVHSPTIALFIKLGKV